MNDYPDISFKCPRCQRDFVIDARGARHTVTCPVCHVRLIVPDKSGDPANEYAEPTLPQPQINRLDERVQPPDEPEFQGASNGIRAPEQSVTTLIVDAFAEYPYNPDLSAAANYVLDAIRTPDAWETKLQRLQGAEKEFGADYRRQHNEEMADFLLHFIRYCLNDHKITPREVDALLELRVLLDIRDGDLYEKRREEVRRLLETQIDWIEADFRIEYAEELYLVDLQRIFDLGYDQLLALAQPHVAEILDSLCLQLSIADRQDIRLQVDQLMRVFCMLHYRLFESTKEALDEVAGRMIPQSVKDAVWRRDGGKCVICGSQEGLEFDHIIPFSLGGSNTYRNVQLLCQRCNRAKAARIG